MTARGGGIELALILNLSSSILSSFSRPVTPEESDVILQTPKSSETGTLGIGASGT